jgi:acetyl-CoA C-acetyltransferase
MPGTITSGLHSSVARSTPVIVGVGQWTRRPDKDVMPSEPAAMMAESLRRAADDTGGDPNRILREATGLWTVETASWQYRNAPSAVSDALGIAPPRHLVTSTTGGEQPQALVNRAALAIAAGDHDIVLIAGGEAFRSMRSAGAAGIELPWTEQSSSVRVAETHPDPRPEASHPCELAVGAVLPTDYYPLFENALRGASGRTIVEHQSTLGALWHNFSSVAQSNPHAWNAIDANARQIATVGAGNRMISFPYTKLLNSNIWVDMAAAIVVCSVDKARSLGIPADRWVFPLASAESHDHWFVTERDQLHRSDAIGLNGREALASASIDIDDVSYIDLYSCFPSAVQIAANALGLPLLDPDRPLTVTGGLTFGGGPGNNYGTHSLATMTETLRKDPGAMGLMTSTGMFLTKHAVALYSTTPPREQFRVTSPQQAVDARPRRVPAENHSGTVHLETYTVRHDQRGLPERAIIVGLTADGARTWSRSSDQDLMAALETEDLLGSSVRLSHGRVTEISDQVEETISMSRKGLR